MMPGAAKPHWKWRNETQISPIIADKNQKFIQRNLPTLRCDGRSSASADLSVLSGPNKMILPRGHSSIALIYPARLAPTKRADNGAGPRVHPSQRPKALDAFRHRRKKY